MAQLRTIGDQFTFTESPRWHEGEFWFIDLFTRRVLTADLKGNIRTRAVLEGHPGGLGFLPDGRAIVVSQLDKRLLALAADGSVADYLDLSDYAHGGLNDMLIDARGRIYVGHFGFDAAAGAEPRPASLILVQPDLSVTVVADDLKFPNGIVLSDDGRTLVVAESFGERLTAFDVNEDGSLSNRTLFAALPGVNPDGISIDSDAGVWVGCTRKEEFIRVEKGGAITDRIATPGRWAVACGLGGAERNILFCATAETTPERIATGDSRGFVELASLAQRERA